jgi:hypothetical protein
MYLYQFDIQKMPIIYNFTMRSGLFKVVLLIGLLTGALYNYSPAIFSRVANTDLYADLKGWGLNALSMLHLDGFLKNQDDQQIQVVVSLLRKENGHQGTEKLAGLHRAIQKLSKTPLCHEGEVDRRIGYLATLDKQIMASLKGLMACQLQGESQNKARILEQILLSRIHELIFWRKSCEDSHQHATNDPLGENALIPVPELVSTTPPSTASSAGISQIPDAREAMPSFTTGLMPSTHKNSVNEVEPDLQNRAKELEKVRVQLKSEDTARRRQFFSQGAKQRWKENSQRIMSQIEQDLKRLDVLMAAAVL